jgi:signal transduction histidine kinase/AraC-like DNA-binding protein
MEAVEHENLKPFDAAEGEALRAALQKRERELTILSGVAARIHAEEEESRILDIALEEILEGMGLATAWIFLGDEGKPPLRLAASRGVSPAYLREIESEGLGECLCPEVFRRGRRTQARNTVQCPRMPHLIEGLAAPVAHACIPLLMHGASRGVLNVAARPGEQFSDDELRFLETLGHQVCVAVERARHRHAERLRNQEARALAAISRAIGGSLDPDAVLRAVGETGRELLGADRVQVLLGADPRALRVAHLSGLPNPALRVGHSLDLVSEGSRLMLAAFQVPRALFVEDWASDARVSQALCERWDAASGIVVPLRAAERTLGLLVLTCSIPRRWSAEQVEMAEALGAQASVTIENARLYDEAKQSYRELKEAQARIIQSEKMAVVGTFASGLAHEVRNPLNSINLQLSILERRLGRMEPAATAGLRELTGVIREEINRLDGLVGDFLQFSRTNRVQHEPRDLDAVIDEVVRLLRPQARASQVALRRQRVGDSLPQLRIDVERMKQVVLNLLQNAIEAMPQGGVVTIESGLVEGRARFVVRDQGPGLPPDLDVFQLFVTTKAKGTGLGLSIAQQVVLEHGGEIAAADQPGGGAAFVVSLPTGSEDAGRQERNQP